jgi:transposase-like protein
MDRGDGFKGRQFTAEVILWAVRWYLMFPVSYRDLELMLLDPSELACESGGCLDP